MKIASIDIGSNTILMQIVDYVNHSLQKTSTDIVYECSEFARLSENIYQTNNISEDAILRAENILTKYDKICSAQNVDKILAVGTSALREANNSKEVKARLEKCFSNDCKIQIISGEQESLLSFQGAIFGINNIGQQKYLIFDIGGGSTEIVLGDNNSVFYNISIPIGVVKLTEQFNIKQPLSKNVIQTVQIYIKECLAIIDDLTISTVCDTTAIAVSGTPTALASIALGIADYDADKINNYIFVPYKLEEVLQTVYNSDLDTLVYKFHIHCTRADVLSAGGLILYELLQKFQCKKIRVSTNGLRSGVWLDYIKKIMVGEFND